MKKAKKKTIYKKCLTNNIYGKVNNFFHHCMSKIKEVSANYLPNLLINCISVFLGAFVALWSAIYVFDLEGDRQRKDFNPAFLAIGIEANNSINSLKNIKNNIQTDNHNFLFISVDISNGYIKNPLLHKFSGVEYTAVISRYINLSREVNRLLEYVLNDKIIITPLIKDNLIIKLNRLNYYSHIIICQSTLYYYAHKKGYTVSPPNQRLVFEWLKNPDKHSIDEIKKHKKKIESSRDKIHKNFLEGWNNYQDELNE